MSFTSVTELFTIDTNILIYAIDTADKGKQRKADLILERMIGSRCILPLQCLNEFYSATTKKGLPHQNRRSVLSSGH